MGAVGAVGGWRPSSVSLTGSVPGNGVAGIGSGIRIG